MEELFVTYQIAEKLKELGFNENCFGYFGKNQNKYLYLECNYKEVNEKDDNYFTHIIKAPLWQQVIDWFEEKFQYKINYNTHKKSMEYNVLMAINYQKLLIKNKENEK